MLKYRRMKSVLNKLPQKPKTESTDSLCSPTSLLLIFNTSSSHLLQPCAGKRCVEMQYVPSLVENGRFYVEIEENEVCFGKYSPEIENADYLCLNISMLLMFNITNGRLLQ